MKDSNCQPATDPDAGKSKGLIDFIFPPIKEQAEKLTQVSKKHITQIFRLLDCDRV